MFDFGILDMNWIDTALTLTPLAQTLSFTLMYLDNTDCKSCIIYSYWCVLQQLSAQTWLQHAFKYELSVILVNPLL